MTETVEKSCWGITLWAVAVVIGLILLASVFSGAEQSAAITVLPTPKG